jgi:hypothetical protein
MMSQLVQTSVPDPDQEQPSEDMSDEENAEDTEEQ